MKKVGLIIVVLLMIFLLAACGSDTEEPTAAAPDEEAAAPAAGAEKTFEDLVVGYAQIGAESEWRTANTASIKEEAEKLGVELKFSDAQQKQENQIAAIRSYIAEGVDVIGFSPVVETGWETVLQEAKDAGI
ncbi:MAG: substrate-binding domain-containing protein, partial [Chloroflexota bacterium]